MSSVSVLKAAIFGTDDSPYISAIRDKKLHITIPVSKAGAIPAKPPKTPFFQVGLCAEVINLRNLIAPNNLKLLDVESVVKQGETLDTDDGMDQLPESFFDALGVINEEIAQATGFDPDKTLLLPELLAFRKTSEQPRKEIAQTAEPGSITKKDLTDLGLDVDDLAEKGLTIEVINSRGITLKQLQEIAFQ